MKTIALEISRAVVFLCLSFGAIYQVEGGFMTMQKRSVNQKDTTAKKMANIRFAEERAPDRGYAQSTDRKSVV